MAVLKKRITGSRIQKLRKLFATAIDKQQYSIAARIAVLTSLIYSNLFREMKYANLLYLFTQRKEEMKNK
jgi:hypothetical protein